MQGLASCVSDVPRLLVSGLGVDRILWRYFQIQQVASQDQPKYSDPKKHLEQQPKLQGLSDSPYVNPKQLRPRSLQKQVLGSQ